ncbi:MULTISPECIES: methyl-accepting chemotaxis protein [Rhizobium/Agrobacterium group]|uniref:methyl-accepting chemotaxis protein n=1 Tax=Rhizobium/Agrobacterium group TaxID=227290 RepID=UPI0022BFBA43|nr:MULTISPECIES: methyl-accepting chemotaxis protein [Rhizobium/Agrobacterium group]MCZ7486207.1 methyl-accepting chemotaxis protein [Rhizobium rhizogenes]MDA5636022.1 methyl-accepting chemotaxis protein [Agrobacterium sp. ST15.16.024]MDF1891068.1 methyl-accepting chemotaxis protein [Rhizobium rhizogenes]
MSFLKNARISTKILSLIVPISLIGLAGVSIVSVNYKSADTAYSDFIAKNGVGSTELFRANTSLVAIGYDTTLGLMLAEQSVNADEVKATYRYDVKNTIERLQSAQQLIPKIAPRLEPLIDRARNIAATTDKVWQASEVGDFQTGRRVLVEVGSEIEQWRKEIRALSESNMSEVLAGSDLLTDQTNTTITNALMALVALFIAGIVASLFIASRGITGPIETLRLRMTRLADGETEQEIGGLGRKDEVGQMAGAVAIFRDNALERLRLEQEAAANRSLNETERLEREAQKAKDAADTQFAVDQLAGALLHLSEGNVAYRIDTPFVAHLDSVRDNFNASAEKLESTLSRLAQNARGIDAGANEIRSAADDLARRTEQQAASVEETAAALEEITTTVKDSTRRAQEAGLLVSKARSGAEKSGNVVREAVLAMGQIEKSSGEISSIISVIDEIAFQTNLLALNAGVEAARAGDAGKGFAVVAQEVRELAQRSASAAKDIKALITASNEQVRSGVGLVSETGQALEMIIAEVQEINRHVLAIVESAQEQSTGLQQINTAVNQMDQDTQKNAAMVEQSTAASHNLAKEASSLNQLLTQFKTSEKSNIKTANEREIAGVSPARALSLRLANVFSGNTALAESRDNWREF